ncbi:MAG: DUF3095 domain-containing protein [Pseudomonadota bacterium]
MAEDDFYDSLPVQDRFAALTDPASFTPLPPGWRIGAADIEGSTKLVEAGAYKTVNTIGAAVVAAQRNAAPGEFPFVFGGDGAVFAVPPEREAAARKALGEVRRWALDEFGVALRAALAPVEAAREAGKEVAVARYRASKGAHYAMFDGGGVSWVEAEMKKGAFEVPIAPDGAKPDLTGLSCRWTPMEARNGAILSLVVAAAPGAPPEKLAALFEKVIEIEERLIRVGNPAPEKGPGYKWPPEGLELEAKATRGDTPLAKRKRQLWFETLLALLFFRTGLKAGDFDPAHYCATVSANADFRKFDDGLKMTIDCDPPSREALVGLLEAAAEEGLIRYGLYEQDAAIMTCIVPSVTEDDHIHFIDGAAGGYTAAATRMKGAG